MAHPRKDEAIEAIKAHLRDVGSKEWDTLERQFADVPKATFWRWIKDVKDKLSDSPSPQKLQAASKKVRKIVEDLKEVGGMLPATPSPAYLAAKGAEAEASMDFLGRLNLLYAEAEMLRDYSLNSEGGIRMPMYFHYSIKQRCNILQMGLSILQEVYDLRKVQEIHDAILEAVGKVSPEVQRKVIDRLRKLDRERGISS